MSGQPEQTLATVEIDAMVSHKHAKVLEALTDAMAASPDTGVVVVMVNEIGANRLGTRLLGSFDSGDALAAGEAALEWAAQKIATCGCAKCASDTITIRRAIEVLVRVYEGEVVH